MSKGKYPISVLFRENIGWMKREGLSCNFLVSKNHFILTNCFFEELEIIQL